MTELAPWANFYVIVGSAAGALIGLQFVVMTLIAIRPHIAAPEAGAAFATPTIVHFGAVLFLSALLMTPWHAIDIAAILWGTAGAGGVVYIFIVARRMRRQGAYRPVFEDWLFHVVLPATAYGVLVISATTICAEARGALFGVGAAALLLLFAGIHNSWDAVAYHVFVHMKQPHPESATGDDSGANR
jgi:hypothetical protein